MAGTEARPTECNKIRNPNIETGDPPAGWGVRRTNFGFVIFPGHRPGKRKGRDLPSRP